MVFWYFFTEIYGIYKADGFLAGNVYIIVRLGKNMQEIRKQKMPFWKKVTIIGVIGGLLSPLGYALFGKLNQTKFERSINFYQNEIMYVLSSIEENYNKYNDNAPMLVRDNCTGLFDRTYKFTLELETTLKNSSIIKIQEAEKSLRIIDGLKSKIRKFDNQKKIDATKTIQRLDEIRLELTNKIKELSRQSNNASQN